MARSPHRYSDLSAPWQELTKVMQKMNFGVIEGLWLENCQPRITAETRLVTEFRMGGDNKPRNEATLMDYRLSQPILDLWETLTARKEGIIRRLVVKHGLPFSLEIEGVI